MPIPWVDPYPSNTKLLTPEDVAKILAHHEHFHPLTREAATTGRTFVDNERQILIPLTLHTKRITLRTLNGRHFTHALNTTEDLLCQQAESELKWQKSTTQARMIGFFQRYWDLDCRKRPIDDSMELKDQWQEFLNRWSEVIFSRLMTGARAYEYNHGVPGFPDPTTSQFRQSRQVIRNPPFLDFPWEIKISRRSLALFQETLGLEWGREKVIGNLRKHLLPIELMTETISDHRGPKVSVEVERFLAVARYGLLVARGLVLEGQKNRILATRLMELWEETKSHKDALMALEIVSKEERYELQQKNRAYRRFKECLAAFLVTRSLVPAWTTYGIKPFDERDLDQLQRDYPQPITIYPISPTFQEIHSNPQATDLWRTCLLDETQGRAAKAFKLL